MGDGTASRNRFAALARWRSPSPRVRGAVLLLAGVATIAAVVVAVDRLELKPGDLRAAPLVVAAVLATPLTILLNAAELRATAAASGARTAEVGWARSVRTVVLATAANLLPVPAGAALRVQVLHSAGARLAAAAGVQLAAAAVWVGLSVALAGVALRSALGAAAATGGVVLVAAGLLAVGRTATHRPGRAGAVLVAVELAMALIQAARLWLVLLGLGVSATVTQVLVIATASPLAAAAGFFPGGIGLAELLSAVVAPLAGLSAAAGLLAVAVARLLGLAVTVPVAVALGLRDVVTTSAATDRGTAAPVRPEEAP